MLLNKALLIKGLVGTASALGIGTGAYLGKDHISELFRTNKREDAPEAQEGQQDEEPQDADALIKKLSLTCNGTNNTECTITTGAKINIKHESTKSSDNSSSTTSTEAKIKLYKETTEGNYNKNLKLTIEGGDISLTGGTESSQITKLEEFETYEIKKDDDDNKWYLSRKTKAEEGKKKALGLGGITNCSLPTDENTPQTCSNITAEQIKAINFEGKTGNGVTVNSGGTATLTITKVSNSDSDFPNGYKLSLQPTQQVTITTSETITIPANKSVEFKIKKSGSSLTLEKAWTLEKLLEKVGLSGCTATENSNNECSIGNSGLNVKQDSEKLDSKTKDTTTASTGKIKVTTAGDNENYEHDFKFTIEDGDINLTDSKKLEQFETYEIKKEENENKWYFSRKKDALEEKKRILGLPADDESCKLPTNGESSTCSEIDETKLKKINFKDKDSDGASITEGGKVTLTITKSSDSEFSTEGYKFSFNPTQDVTISTSSSIKIKKNTNTEFKIKKEGNTLSLEKAWTVEALAKKAQIVSCTTTDNNKECTLGDKINVIFDNSGSEYSLDETNKAKKLKYEEDQENYNQGFKFYAEEEITFTGESDSNKKIEKKENDNGATYEIKQQSDKKWYLSKVTATPAA